MFNIVFAGDEDYLKYIAVCITSIVKNTDVSKSFTHFVEPLAATEREPQFNLENGVHEAYVFHILTDYVSENTKSKLQQLATELSIIFPTEIQVHMLSGEDFLIHPKWANSYLPYYRLKIGEIFSTQVGKALYLDGDMLVNCDIRELFAVNLGDTVCASVANICPMTYALTGRMDDIQYELSHHTNYFNSGMMLCNLLQWRGKKITEKSLRFLSTYIVKAVDQDTLNAVIRDDFTKLPYKWNMMVDRNIALSDIVCKDESPDYNTQHSRADYIEGRAHPKIIHYSMKPWNGLGAVVTCKYNIVDYPNFELWWDMASRTPIFKSELESIKESKKYKKQTRKHQKLLKMFDAGPLSFAWIWFKFKRKSRPHIQKVKIFLRKCVSMCDLK